MAEREGSFVMLDRLAVGEDRRGPRTGQPERLRRLGGPAAVALVRGDEGEASQVVAATPREVESQRLRDAAVEQPPSGQARRLVGQVAQRAVGEVERRRRLRGRGRAAAVRRARPPSRPRIDRWRGGRVARSNDRPMTDAAARTCPAVSPTAAKRARSTARTPRGIVVERQVARRQRLDHVERQPLGRLDKRSMTSGSVVSRRRQLGHGRAVEPPELDDDRGRRRETLDDGLVVSSRSSGRQASRTSSGRPASRRAR